MADSSSKDRRKLVNTFGYGLEEILGDTTIPLAVRIGALLRVVYPRGVDTQSLVNFTQADRVKVNNALGYLHRKGMITRSAKGSRSSQAKFDPHYLDQFAHVVALDEDSRRALHPGYRSLLGWFGENMPSHHPVGLRNYLVAGDNSQIDRATVRFDSVTLGWLVERDNITLEVYWWSSQTIKMVKKNEAGRAFGSILRAALADYTGDDITTHEALMSYGMLVARLEESCNRRENPAWTIDYPRKKWARMLSTLPSAIEEGTVWGNAAEAWLDTFVNEPLADRRPLSSSIVQVLAARPSSGPEVDEDEAIDAMLVAC